jgi:aminocarboxymuconate-semialdehyde decarboxylase
MTEPNVAPRPGPRVVDAHIHAVPPPLIHRVDRGLFCGVAITGDERGFRMSFPGMQPSPASPSGLANFGSLAERGRDMGIDIQIVGPWTDLFGYTLPRAESAEWSRAYNEDLVRACADYAGLVPTATIPLQYPDLAASEMEHAHVLGCRGVMIGSDIPGLALDSPELDEVWETAAQLRLPMLLHPTFVRIPQQLQYRGLKNAVARVGEITTALARLVYSGALLRHPDLVVIGALGGGAVVPFTKRIIRNHDLGWSETATDVEASMQRLFFDSVVLDPTYLRYLVEQVGAERMVMGSDFPFPWEPDPVQTVLAAGLSVEDASAVLGKTASKVYGLS